MYRVDLARSIRSHLLALSILAGLSPSEHSFAAPLSIRDQRYTAVLLVTDSASRQMGINDLGEVVLQSSTRGLLRIKTRDREGNPILDSGLMQTEIVGPSRALVTDNNNLGEIVGHNYPSATIDAFSIRDGHLIDVNAQEANAINDDGSIVGFSPDVTNDSRGYVLQPGGTLIVADQFWTRFTSINNVGTVVGGASGAGCLASRDYKHCATFLTAQGQLTQLRTADDINDFNIVVAGAGVYNTETRELTRLYGSRGEYGPYAINNLGQVTYTTWNSGILPPQEEGARIFFNGQSVELSEITDIPGNQGSPFTSAPAINNRGDILARNGNWTYVLFPRYSVTCDLDWNGDGSVGLAEFRLAHARINKQGHIGDANRDGRVSFDDVTTILANWGPCRGFEPVVLHPGSPDHSHTKS